MRNVWTVIFGVAIFSINASAADFDTPVSPADDERDNILNVTPHAEFVGNSLYEFLPQLSRVPVRP